MNYKILNENLVYKGFLKIKKAMITHDCFHKQEPVTCFREVLDCTGCVAVLVYEKDTECFILINQFRYPTIKSGSGWFLEIPAGSLEENEEPVVCAIREVEEETGYQVDNLEHITTFYASPGSSSEQMYLYFGVVTKKDKIYLGGGLQTEDEDIKVCKYHLSELDSLLQPEGINDAKTIIALQWFKMKKLPLIKDI
ncbi:NUDIX domain-containing protein [Aquimarina longa]|uniref:NUDIX domain-containing protein n=1 Tax=Aquimarina longa TaxID=1080221 RepID=UPI000785480A|nr:NUDIX hydrolase [Aquimarina longa]